MLGTLKNRNIKVGGDNSGRGIVVFMVCLFGPPYAGQLDCQVGGVSQGSLASWQCELMVEHS